MSSEIQFGDVNQAQPQVSLRPDQDGSFCVAEIGNVGDGELMIFVDLDVLRDMEAHARTDTQVELGGVMLGRQYLDQQDRAFVTITDCLRARHYQATKGSFKFTHDTWSQITAERKKFHPDLEMVGWYHTHPGWSVFLSGMDLFICNHFFNRPLDVALVIDPVANDRGWFQWTAGEKPETCRTNGFYLTTNRYRQHELEYFARIYNREPPLNRDPRYSQVSFVDSAAKPFTSNNHPTDEANQYEENSMNRSRPIFELTLAAMVMAQFVLLALIAWKLVTPNTTTTGASQVASVKPSEFDHEPAMATQNEIYRDILSNIVESRTGEQDLVEKFAHMQTENQQLRSNMTAQIALSEQLNSEKDTISRQQQKLSDDLELQKKIVSRLRDKLTESETKLTETKQALAASDSETSESNSGLPVSTNWWWIGIGGLATTVVGGSIGYLLGRNLQPESVESTSDVHQLPDNNEETNTSHSNKALEIS